ncbi:hypothetical protein [Aquimarina sp. 2201CG5-10]|uniref:hypothetical protein n=1 Tax=Aquimarina callyspongiae TaxID=3098150 RepID=UPI002AB3A422|nr:hypothetical protein [Aquimarina sp. 2201CG5-10]MDY8138066.1 hypothetical protein [Aquimarina sp. 2201CG5-10]
MKKNNSFLSILMVLIMWPIFGRQQDKSYFFEEAQQEYYKQNPKALLEAREFEKIIKKKTELKKE